MTTNQTQIAIGSAFKKLTFSLFLLFTCVAFAQVGVGTQTPATTLDVVGAAGNTPGALNTIDGIAVPVVTDDKFELLLWKMVNLFEKIKNI
jgi:hypothetical protein